MAELNFNIDNIVINRAIAGTMFDKTTSEPLFYLNQITEPSLECTGEAADVVDAQGIKIASFDRSKSASLSGSSALVNLGLAAAQLGGEKKIAGVDVTSIEVPVRETPSAVGGKLTLEGTPKAGYEITFINEMTKDGGLGTPYSLEGTVEGAVNTFTMEGQDIILPEGVADGTKFIVFYKKDTESGVVIENSAEIFAKGGEFVLEVLLADICDTTKVFHGYVIFPNAKMSNETTIDFNNEATHGFTIEAMQDYCDESKKLFEIIVTE